MYLLHLNWIIDKLISMPLQLDFIDHNSNYAFKKIEDKMPHQVRSRLGPSHSYKVLTKFCIIYDLSIKYW